MQRLRRLFVVLAVIVAVCAIAPASAFAVSAQNSSVVRAIFPTTMVANTTYRAVVTMRNTGSSTWLARYSYGLRALGNSDPFTRTVAFGLSKTEKITRGRNRTFVITMKAPSTPGTYVTDWRMYTGRHTGFGATIVRKVTVVPATLSSISISTLPTKLHYLTGDVLDLSGMVVTGSYNDGTTKVLSVAAGDVTGFNTDAASISQLLTVTVGGKTATFAIDVTEKKPVISNVHIESNSAKGADKATLGDTITLSFTTDEPVSKLSNFKINGSNPDTFTTDAPNHYITKHLVDSGDSITGQPATFQINVKNALGIYSQTIEVTNDGSSVTIVDPKPVISNVHFESTSVRGKTVAEDGDTLILSFTSDEPVSKLSNFKINGSNPDTFTMDAPNHYIAKHLVDAGDKVTGEPATFQINVKNAAGIFSQTVEATNDGSSVLITLPIHDVSITSNSAKGTDKAYNGDTITLSFTTDEPVDKLSNFKINGSNPDTFVNDGSNHYTVTHLVDSGDAITGQPATFQINVKNAAGIYSQTIEVTSDKTSVTIVDAKPVISAVSFKSNSSLGTTQAVNGDILTLTFTSDEAVEKLSNFKINGSNPDTFTHVGNVYTATHLVDPGDPVTGQPATFQINVKNVRGIFSQTIEVTNDGSFVTIMPSAPPVPLG